MHRIVSAAPAVLLSLFLGCSDSTGPVSLGLNRIRWEKQNLHDYVYTGRMSCFCGHSGEDVTVVVLADTVFSARVAGTTVELPRGIWLTVDEFFDLAQHSPGGYVERVRVEYHPALGYPTFIEQVCSPDIADCGVTIEIKNLGPVSFEN